MANTKTEARPVQSTTATPPPITSAAASARLNELLSQREAVDVQIEAARVAVIETAQRETQAREAKLREAGTAQLNAIAAGAAEAEAKRQHTLTPTVSIQRGARLV